MKPDDAGRDENEFDVKTNIEFSGVHRRKCPEVEVGDKVWSFRKKKQGEAEGMINFEEGAKTVKEITKSLGQTYYKLDDERVPTPGPTHT